MIDGSFKIDPDLKSIDNTFIAGYKTADILRNGTKTDTWQYLPIKDVAILAFGGACSLPIITASWMILFPCLDW